ncbi:dolichol-phosphate mannosyltransferase [Clostridium cavendishii DSM 21758]|uniref:Dolichol-phosphate mannosyltransferase n=1 Tax=Clostridium cavendishii DSM 21758 TaxID=1121302 RepID=A0A1M6JB45_9CLOT|nr:glycosyltransferase family 2 protein [Clostridium cavendishii]SHJ43915.1 dolichol-phosphate mannosyltransferase [Clostridium cavendishii DSM 21758]
MDKKFWVLLPCYNEQENIQPLVNEWQKEREKLKGLNLDLRIIIVNDGSKDNTLNISEELSKSYDNIFIINHDINKGLGEAINTGLLYAINQREDGYICTMDGDLTHSPSYVQAMLEKMRKDELDCVIASRYRHGSEVQGLARFRKLLSYGARVIYTLALRIPNVRDYTCGYRIYTKKSIIDLNNIYGNTIVVETGFACMMELLYKIHINGNKIGEVPFILKYQLKGGASKMKVMRTVLRSLTVLLNIRSYNKHTKNNLNYTSI